MIYHIITSRKDEYGYTEIEWADYKKGESEEYDQFRCECGSEDFKVFSSIYFTKVKCAKCGNEAEVHSG